MKSKMKKRVALLVVFALIQLMFPFGLVVYEDVYKKNILKKGERYTLNYTQLVYMNKSQINTNVEERYTVGYNWDFENAVGDELPHDTLDLFSVVGVEKREDGSPEFFDIENNKKKKTDYNWFRVYDAFNLDLEDYEFVRDDFGMKELFELSLFLCEDEYNETKSFEEFLQSEDLYLYGLHHIALEGKIVFCVYKGHSAIAEFYIGDELVLRHKQ